MEKPTGYSLLQQQQQMAAMLQYYLTPDPYISRIV